MERKPSGHMFIVQKIRVGILITLGATIALPACETTTHGQQGEIIGGVLGGVLGSHVGDGRGETAAIIVGVIAGALIGRHIGESMDDTDRVKTAMILNDSRTGQITKWTNPDTGYDYAVTPTRTFERDGGPCREFQLDASIGGRSNQDIYGIACLQSDGSWLVQ